MSSNLTERELGQIIRSALTRCTPITRSSGIVTVSVPPRILMQQTERKVQLYGRGNR